ncbi:FAD-binding oxidoreductase [Halobacillus litoralis]|uniref:FAD-binding oxidoreductase n=1 Tax=Halobacillus litoralis TaxID=45668 RepID=UPI001CD6293A|nr:FAD-binding oxidoreductase [Halobacillus litoralis]MCA0971311.1 FAD-binding oxidoreductase [Halobacillus litoralis]
MFEQLQSEMSGKVVLPGHPNYEETRAIFNAAVKKQPAAIAVCKDERDVSKAVKFANEHAMQISVRGGGHHVSGTSLTEGGLLIDLSEMRHVTVDEESKTAKVGGGALLSDVDAETQKFGLATPTGTVSETGIGGLALAGGLGYLRAKYGLSCDNISAAKVVTADGSVLEVSENEYSDLFWAIRGGGGNFGVVTEFEFRLHDVGPNVLALDVMYDLKDADQIYQQLDQFVETAPDEISLNVTVMDLPPLPELPEFLHFKPVMIVAGMYAGEVEEGKRVIQPLRELAVPIADQSGVVPYTQLQSKLDAMVPKQANFKGSSLFFSELSPENWQSILKEKEIAPGHLMLQLWETHGKMNRIPADDNAFAIRDARYVLLLDIMYEDEQEEACAKWIEAFYEKFSPISFNGAAYLNGIDPEDHVIRKTYADNYEQLLELKQKYDPHNVFRMNHNIRPSSVHSK